MVTVFLLTTGLLAVACSNPAATSTAPAPPTPPVSTANISTADLNTLYLSNCAVCHGEKRFGVTSSGGALTPESLEQRSDAAITETISEGIPYTNMPAWKTRLSREEISALTEFIKYSSP